MASLYLMVSSANSTNLQIYGFYVRGIKSAGLNRLKPKTFREMKYEYNEREANACFMFVTSSQRI